MKWLRRPKTSTAAPDMVRLVATALALQQFSKTVGDGGDPPAMPDIRPSDENHAHARSLLYDFAMEHFSTQVEVLRREAVIEHLANDSRDRLAFTRLAAIGAVGTLAALGANAAGTALARHFGVDLEAMIGALRPLAAALRATTGA
ncbi:MAG: hypothetical protein JNK67_27395 [Alphaproteobacteria bacterium]|nr:hypothetical protein [Alphaproteobacteria bacterium]